MDSGTSAVIAAVIGGATGFLSSYLSTQLAHRYQLQALKSEILRDHLKILLPNRQEAFQIVWSFLVRASMEKTITEEDRNRYIASSIWLPASLRSASLEILSKLDDKSAIRHLQEKLLRHIASFEQEG